VKKWSVKTAKRPFEVVNLLEHKSPADFRVNGMDTEKVLLDEDFDDGGSDYGEYDFLPDQLSATAALGEYLSFCFHFPSIK
jgi:hypothetical protein